jgi:dual specificity protein kinase YAK1
MDDIDSSDGAAAARAGEIGSIGVSTPWKPIQLVFKRYLPQNGSASKVHVAVKKPVVVRLTRDLVETYKICDPQFKYRGELNPKRYLTTPSVGVNNDGFDNVNYDLILAVNDDFCSSDSRQRFAIVLFIFNFYYTNNDPPFVVLSDA